MMELVLPPFSALYTTFEDFFPAFRMTNQAMEDKTIGGRGSTPVTKRCFGYFNTSANIVRFRSHDIVPPEMSTEDLLKIRLRNRKITWNAAFAPNNVQMQIEVGDQPSTHFSTAREEDLTLEGVTAAFENLTALAREQLNLSQPVVRVHSSPDGSVSLCNNPVKEHMADYGSTVVLTMDPEAAVLLGLPPEMSFPMDSAKYFPLRVRALLTDPFAGLYPVLVVARDFEGATRSYVEKLGDVAVLGILRPGGHMPHSQGLTFENDRSRLTVEFYDKSFRQITFDNEYEFLLTLAFNDPFSNSPQVPRDRTWN